MHIQRNISLKSYNTFGIDANAAFFCAIDTVEDLRQALSQTDPPKKLILSGGSNILLTQDLEALVLHINIKGKTVVSETEDHVFLKVMAGENWHELVLWTLEHGYGGLENLSLIPGKTGTAPIQNIGAYGVELKDLFVQCEAMAIEDRTIDIFDKSACAFGYRDSYFKNEGKDLYIITSVTLRLTKKNHVLNTVYGAIAEELEGNGISHPTIRDISNVVVAIRRRKLPDPQELGNSGSFFKNPVISAAAFKTFAGHYKDAPYYKVSDTAYKIPAGWLIEQCGFKGKRFGDAGVHKNQALVLVNYGKATGKEILALAHTIIQAVAKKFDIQITPEVNIIK